MKKIDEIQQVEDEFFVYLIDGFCLPGPPPQHCFGERSVGEVKETMKRVVKCSCVDCKKQKKEGKSHAQK